MSLTGSAFPVTLALGAVLLFIALVIGWPRLRNRWIAGAVRGLFTLLLNAGVVTLAFVMLNDQYGFYPSWQDLTGYHATSVTVRHGAATRAAGAARVPGVGFSAWHTPAQLPALPEPGQQMQRYYIAGPRSGFHNAVNVYLPAGYDPSSMRTYPVILALHGYPGSPVSFTGVGILSTIDNLVAQHRMAAPIVVMPVINDPVDLDTECVNARRGPQAETWLASDIPQWVVDHFRVQSTRTSWATWGFSFGGWCSAMLAMRHPDLFGASVAMEGYFLPDFSDNYVPFRPGSKGYAAYDMVRLARMHPPPIALWLLSSKEDSLSYPSSAAMARDARAPMSVTAILLDRGGHIPSVWKPKVATSFEWLAQTLPGFDPLSAVLALPYRATVASGHERR